MSSQSYEFGYLIFSVLTILAVVAILWFVMWKFVFEPNPVIREFFDLNAMPTRVKTGQEKGSVKVNFKKVK